MGMLFTDANKAYNVRRLYIVSMEKCKKTQKQKPTMKYRNLIQYK